MDQRKLSRPATRLLASVPTDAENTNAESEAWLSKAREFTAPGEPGFVQAVDSLRPGPLLYAVIEQSLNDLNDHSHAELAAVARACGRLATYARLQQLVLVGELARRCLAASADAA